MPVDRTPYQDYVRTEFGYASFWAANPEPKSYATAVHLSTGTDLLPRDILVMGMYATLYDFEFPDGTKLGRVRDVAPNPQLVLDLVTTVDGSILWRSPAGWVGLGPGNSGQVLAVIDGVPTWQDVYPISIEDAQFITAAPHAELPNAKVAADSATILRDYTIPHFVTFMRAALTGDVTAGQGSNVTTIAANSISYAKLQQVSATSRVLGRASAGAGVVEELTLNQVLDFIGSATRGDVLYRGASSWARLPAGTSGNYLKTLGSSADPTWATVASGLQLSATSRILGRASAGAGAAEELTLTQVLDFIGSAARGDLLFRGSSTWSRLAGGVVGSFLQTNGSSGDPTWAPVAGGLGVSGMGSGPAGVFFRDASVYLTSEQVTGNAFTTLSLTANTLFQVPIVVPFTRTFTSIAINVSAGAVGKTARLGIYSNAADTNGGPGGLLVDCGTVSVASTGIRTVSFSLNITPGVYWLALVSDGAPSVRAVSAGFLMAGAGVNFTAATPACVQFLARSFSFATLPADETSQTYSLNNAQGTAAIMPMVGIR